MTEFTPGQPSALALDVTWLSTPPWPQGLFAVIHTNETQSTPTVTKSLPTGT